MGSEVEAVTRGDDKSHHKEISKRKPRHQGSVNNFLALTGRKGQWSFHKDMEPIISRLGRPIVGKELKGFVDNRSLVFGNSELLKSMVGVIADWYICINLRKGT